MELFMALLPALIMITLVIVTRRVLTSLLTGVILAALIYADFAPLEALKYLWDSLYAIATSIDWYLPILGFVVLIGAITSTLAFIGGIKAFAQWGVSKVKNRVASQALTGLLGVIICIDDYFNALVIGEVSIPLTDAYKVSRAKLAYLIDSTSAPVVIMMPLSTWGAYIIAILGGLFAGNDYTLHSGFSAFLSAVPYQFYPLTAIALVFITLFMKRDLGAMKTYEKDALKGNDHSQLVIETKAVGTPENTGVTHHALIVSIATLVGTTLILMFALAGFRFSSLLDQDITIPLFFGGLVSFMVALTFGVSARNVNVLKMGESSLKGMLSMAKSAIPILILAWMVSGAVQDLEAGNLIASAIEGSNISLTVLPVTLFLVAGGMAFATGTSWGAFGILLPIAVPIAIATDATFMPLFIAAVLGGAVFGDHASPVSDTTVLSATGAQSKLHAHFISQLPYVLISAGIASLAYVTYGLFESLLLSYLVLIIAITLFAVLLKRKPTTESMVE
ncbi:MAG: Na+/H+ antiporter NhaC family protein [Bacillota bacterium]